ncbi:endothelin-converting enzyme 1-like isoform X2 [Liolophura sinensis]|uniref:endothelin-converting enzyme 1-like isoform X2 n=1 Tax=Liolophura sinensis TaxID=3198878 RepID=UPI00315857B6
MSYFRLALSGETEDENSENSAKGMRDHFLMSSDWNKNELDSDTEDELYTRKREEHDRERKKLRQMTFFLGVAVLLIVLLSTLLVWQHFITTETPCVSPSCVESAGYIVSKMDFSTDPCKDFYTYACGGWEKKAEPPPNKPKWSTFSATYKKNSVVLKNLLEKDDGMYLGKTSTAVKKSQEYFKLCMNNTAVEERGITPALKLIKELGSWTVTSDQVSGQWDKSNWKPMDTLVKVHKYNEAALFGMGVGTDDKNNTANIITFSQGGLTLSSREGYLTGDHENLHKAFLRFSTQYAKLLGGDNDTEAKMEQVYQFEKQLAEIFVKEEDMLTPSQTYHKMTIAQFQTLIGNSIPLQEYLTAMFGENIPETENVIVTTPDYFKKLDPLLQKTKPEVLVDYLVWSLMQAVPGYLPSDFSKAALELDRVESGVTELGPKWWRCVSKADSAFGFATGGLYVEDPSRFHPDTKKKIEDILGEIQDTFIEELPTVDWMSPEVKEIAIEKARAVKKKVAYPDWVKRPSKLDKYYEKVVMTDSFFESMLNIRRFYLEKDMDKRGKPPDVSIWSQTPAVVNAYYSPSHNYFAFPAGILQRPFYDPDFPEPFNYGSIGFVMGHELTHGFDNTGRLYDKQGNLHNWWNNQSLEAFKERSKCMIEQYDKYKIQGRSVRGDRTLGENIADNGGIKVAYRAYQKWLMNNTPAKQLPGLPPSDLKLFFIGFAQVWCSYYTPAYARTALLTDAHSPAKYRVIGTLSNSEEFSDAFNCRKGATLMNPENKCQVW